MQTLLLALCLGSFHAWKPITHPEGERQFQRWHDSAAGGTTSISVRHIIEEDDTLVVGDYCAKRWTGTKTRLSKLAKRNLVKLNGRPVFATQKCSVGDLLELSIESDVEKTDTETVQRIVEFHNHILNTLPPPGPGTLNPFIIYEDDHCAVLAKPAGVHSLVWVNTMKRQSLTFDSILPLILVPSKNKDCLQRPLPCHRLDARVSGCIVCAKTSTALSNINRQFEKRQVSKKYTAVVCGNISAALERGVLADGAAATPSISISKYENGMYKLTSIISGAVAETTISPVESVQCPQYGVLTLVELSPITGRRHQLRIHCAALGSPIFGDDLFFHEFQAVGNKAKVVNVRKGEGLFLACTGVSFWHPAPEDSETTPHHIAATVTAGATGAQSEEESGRRVVATAPVPMKFRKLMERAARGSAYQENSNTGT